MKTLLKIGILFLCSVGLLQADSLLRNEKFGAPMAPYKRSEYVYKVRDTITVNVSIDDTIQFSKKQDYKRDVSWLNAFKSFITHFGGVNQTQPNVELESSNEFKSNGQKQGTSRIRLEVPCEVVEIMPNGDLVIDGTRTIKADENNAMIRIGGRVNPKYISPLTDSVFSERILGLDVKTFFEGPLADNEKRGFLGKILDKFKLF